MSSRTYFAFVHSYTPTPQRCRCEAPPDTGRCCAAGARRNRAPENGGEKMAPVDPPITVVIADDHQLFRESLKTLLETDPGIRVVGEAENGRDVITLAR